MSRTQMIWAAVAVVVVIIVIWIFVATQRPATTADTPPAATTEAPAEPETTPAQ